MAGVATFHGDRQPPRRTGLLTATNAAEREHTLGGADPAELGGFDMGPKSR